MKRYAIVEADTIVNVAVWDGESDWEPSASAVEVPDNVGIGYVLVNGEWTQPPMPN